MNETKEAEAMCPDCYKMVKYVTEYRDESIVMDGRKLSYKGQRAFCPVCGAEVRAADVEDYNAKAVKEAYCIDRGLVTPREVKDFTERYHVSAGRLTKVLRWKSGTIKRYMDGDVPTRRHSEKLRAIMDDEEEYYRLLYKSRKRILRWAFKESLRDITHLTDERTVDRSIANFDSCVRLVAASRLKKGNPQSELSVKDYSGFEAAKKEAEENGSVVIESDAGDVSRFVLEVVPAGEYE